MLQLLRLEAVDGQHFHTLEACGLDGGSSLVEAEGQAATSWASEVMMTLPPIFCHSPSSHAPG